LIKIEKKGKKMLCILELLFRFRRNCYFE